MKKIGDGGACTVFKATEKSTGVVRALKRSEWGLYWKFIINEVDVMKILNGHENIIHYLRSYRDGDFVYIVMGYSDYVSLRDLYVHLKSEGIYLNELQIAYILRGIVGGLRRMRDKRIIHKDIKSANVLIGKDGHVIIIDFNLSIKLKRFQKKSKDFHEASLNWTAPEVIWYEAYDGKADVWSLVMTLVEMIDGDFPYGHLNEKAVKKALMDGQPPKINRLEMSGELTQLFLQTAMIVNPKPKGFMRTGGRPIVTKLAKHPLLKLLDKNPDVFSTLKAFVIAAGEKNIAALKERDQKKKESGHEQTSSAVSLNANEPSPSMRISELPRGA